MHVREKDADNLISLFLGSLESVDVEVDFDSIEHEIHELEKEVSARLREEKKLRGAALEQHRFLTDKIDIYAQTLNAMLHGMRKALEQGGARGLLQYLACADDNVREALTCFATCRKPPNRRAVKTNVGYARSLGYRWRAWRGLIVEFRYRPRWRELTATIYVTSAVVPRDPPTAPPDVHRARECADA